MVLAIKPVMSVWQLGACRVGVWGPGAPAPACTWVPEGPLVLLTPSPQMPTRPAPLGAASGGDEGDGVTLRGAGSHRQAHCPCVGDAAPRCV